MNDDAKNALISYRMERASESVEAARLMLDNAMPTSAMNRIYLCCTGCSDNKERLFFKTWSGQRVFQQRVCA